MGDPIYKVWMNVELIDHENDHYEEVSEVTDNGEEYLSSDEAEEVMALASMVTKGSVVLTPELVEDLVEVLNYNWADEEKDFEEQAGYPETAEDFQLLAEEGDLEFSRIRFGKKEPLTGEEMAKMPLMELASHCDTHIIARLARLYKALGFKSC